MGLKSTLIKLFGNHAETSDTPQDPALKTRYFKVNKDTAYDALYKLFQKKGYDIVAESKDHGEISANIRGKRKMFIVASVIMVQPFRTAIDLTVTVESSLPFDFGYRYRQIQNIYDELKQTLPYITD
ncbi:hypothetical protein EDD68_10468 [Melghiribacillus thermohalophilus]|uniref:Cytosolic protein n=1 Tax=Melghiribacillus thermohalophilus TaxID=1324956 RepID=A0A4R3N8Z5_9BACI|nr:cytosolic protein [Melghiribacillus thermohalophilus]TCT25001.1 hypothetical protein EDD68_10468 [Melghiribacillus thermohalophilus]